MRNPLNMCCRSILAVLLCFLVFPVYSQTESMVSPLSLGIVPNMNLPLKEDKDLFTIGGGTDIIGRLQLPLSSLFDFTFLLDFGYQYIPVKADTTISTVSLGIGAGLNWKLLHRLHLGGYLEGGYFYSLLNDTSILPSWEENIGGGSLYISGGLTASYQFISSFSIGLDAAYRKNLDLSTSIVLSLSGFYHFPKKAVEQQVLPYRRLVFSNQHLDDLFPVFYAYYDDQPIGKAVLSNTGSVPVENIRVSIYVEQYMANPKFCDAPHQLGPGENGEILFYGLFSDALLDILESTKVSALISVECSVGDRMYRNEYSETLRIHDRNAMSWDDDRKAAAFVTMKDTSVLSFSRAVLSATRRQFIPGFNDNLLTGLAMHQALKNYGISYVIDPNTPYSILSQDAQIVDYLQFPRQTLEYSTGDCDDLSILTCALLEAVGIETAFITVPGHIYIAFSLGISPNEAKSQFLRPEDLIFLRGKTWLPLEVTEIDGGFIAAWESGALQWRKNHSLAQARLYPTAASWKSYPPVGLPGEPVDFFLPNEEDLFKNIQNEAERLVRRELSPRVESLKSQMENNRENPRIGNRLGVLYARYSLLEEAEKTFLTILEVKEYGPTLINMGNIYFLQQRNSEALEYLERAENLSPENPRLLLALARVQHIMGEYARAETTFTLLKKMDPVLASSISFVASKEGQTNRASEVIRLKETIIWEE